LIKDYRSRFVRLGEVSAVSFGIKSGCDAFFMPHDVTHEVLAELKKGLLWNNLGLMTACKRSEIEGGMVRIVRAGDNTLHPIETKYLKSELHSLMQVDRPVIRASDSDRVVLWVNEPLNALAHSYVAKYIRWGSKQTFASSKSKAVPVPQRETCASRPIWYDLTTATNGVAFWPMTQKYRHIVAANPDGIVCNHRLFYIAPRNLSNAEAKILPAILNSTLVALVKHFYGRYAGTEGTLDTEIIDCLLLDVPDPKRITSELFTRMSNTFERICSRPVTHLVADSMLQCHSMEAMREILAGPVEFPTELVQEDRLELDDCVFELMGVGSKKQRKILLDELYLVTTEYYRYLRTQDIQAMQNRTGNGIRRFDAQDLAGSIWQSLSEDEQGPAVAEWIKIAYPKGETVRIPEGKPNPFGASDMFDPNGVVFKGNKETDHVSYANSEQAALVAALAENGIRGSVEIPKSSMDCGRCLQKFRTRIKHAQDRFTELAASRTGTQSLQEKTATLLMHWYIHGRDL
jgi:hypothetical protein